ncbi:hypothetical protein CHARACLAT_032059 [Characodon lateralis]|uniref:Uncharacterized protein n=1 Tax=Characodon lateralis TaxID=208331 RepID=A0ABU7F1R7_9TELE|nr:hypothetical protein [Characodon lateralis]
MIHFAVESECEHGDDRNSYPCEEVWLSPLLGVTLSSKSSDCYFKTAVHLVIIYLPTYLPTYLSIHPSIHPHIYTGHFSNLEMPQVSSQWHMPGIPPEEGVQEASGIDAQATSTGSS